MPCKQEMSILRLPRSAKQRGLTLIELLVAISVLAFVAVLGWRGLDSIVRARVALNEDLAQTRGMQLAFAQMQNDCANIMAPSPFANRAAVVAGQDELMLVRHVYADNQPSRVQVVNYRVRNGVLSRWESAATRDLQELEQIWQAASNTSGAADASGTVALRSGVSAMTMRLWLGTTNNWVISSASNAPASGTGTGTGTTPPADSFAQLKGQRGIERSGVPQWTGLEVTLQTDRQDSSMLKVFLLGTM